ncbi:hypothetical protein KQI65_16575 [bacterium]|nr:hypothetical protein [bacterium]
MKLLAICCIVLLFTACDDDTSVTPRDWTELTQQRTAWENLNIHDYEITQSRLCFCFHGGAPVRLVVRADTLVSGMLLEDSTMLTREELQWYKTVDQLFDFAQDIDPNDVAQFDLEYDSLQHYPSRIWVDYSVNVADEEMGYNSGDLTPQ